MIIVGTANFTYKLLRREQQKALLISRRNAFLIVGNKKQFPGEKTLLLWSYPQNRTQ
jgi:hypothetical protein